LPDRRRKRHGALIVPQLERVVPAAKLVPDVQLLLFDPLSVDVATVRAAEILQHDPSAFEGDLGVVAGNRLTLKTNGVVWKSTNAHHRRSRAELHRHFLIRGVEIYDPRHKFLLAERRGEPTSYSMSAKRLSSLDAARSLDP
jgi:hypothetical protein